MLETASVVFAFRDTRAGFCASFWLLHPKIQSNFFLYIFYVFFPHFGGFRAVSQQ